MNRFTKVLLHTAVDVFELTNELEMRLIERTELYKHYNGFVLRLLECPIPEERLNAMSEASNAMARAMLDAITLRCRMLIDGDLSIDQAVSCVTEDYTTFVQGCVEKGLDLYARDMPAEQAVN